ncbi:MAG TPA: glycerophosphodiester phosphodiesterase [Acetobacteraceae bacterium]|nr:glycerophosphodiester phosphodiesterase [Acetobacteraceae bacterium]
MAHRIVLHGHRGARGLFPENTLEGFAGALAIGVDVLELDVALTADDVVVVTHDPRLNPDITRTSDGVWLCAPGPAIRTMTAAALARYDVGRVRPGSAYAFTYPEQVPHDGARIPTLRQVLKLGDQVDFNVELKSFPWQPGLAADAAAMADAVVALARNAGALDRLIVQSFDWRGPRQARRSHPELQVAWLTSRALLAGARTWWDGPHPTDFGGSVARAVAAEGGPTWGPDYLDLSEATVAEAHELGLRVVPWTVNRPDDMRRLISWGVDGLITDRPDIARITLADAGCELPPSRRMKEVSRG